MSHQCNNVMLKCMDFRLQNKTLSWIKENYYFGDCDVISNAGSGKALVDGTPEVKEFILNEIGISYERHGAKNVILVHHSDCGAYKSYNFANIEEEKTKQIEDMRKEETIIKEKFPDVTIIKIWAQMNDENGNDIEFQKIV
ncbi:MAG: carbonic anhydrase [Candidatus Paceibacterota bacterium]